jgi:hypothetical protein
MPGPAAARNMREYLAEFIGAGHGKGEASSENTGQQFADHLVEMRRNGTL